MCARELSGRDTDQKCRLPPQAAASIVFHPEGISAFARLFFEECTQAILCSYGSAHITQDEHVFVNRYDYL